VRAVSWIRDESGGATVYAMFVLALSAMLGGLAIDASNAWRGRGQLDVIATIASHAGAVSLAQDASPESVAKAVSDIITRNHADDMFQSELALSGEPGLGKPVQVLHYDPEDNRLEKITLADTAPNAVVVRVRHDQADGSALPTFFLNALGIASWDLDSYAVAALIQPSQCAAGDAVVSRDLLLVEGKLAVGEGFCFHAQQLMEFSLTPILKPGARLSLPDLEACQGTCADLLATPEGLTAATELNVLQPDFSQQINAAALAFGNSRSTNPERLAFFQQRRISRDLSPLAELGIDVENLVTGAVVDLEPIQVERARHLPQGLVYRVSCADQPEDMFLVLGGPGPTLHGSALITDCPVVVAQVGGLSRALLISTWKGIAGVDLPAIEVMAHEMTKACPRTRSVLMAQAPVFLLPGASGRGLGLVSATEIALFPDSEKSLPTNHYGLSLHAGKSVDIRGNHRFEACGVLDEERLLPQMRIIRQVMPNNMDEFYPPRLTPSEGARHVTPKEEQRIAPQDDVLASLP
jgi:hypothetical protein